MIIWSSCHHLSSFGWPEPPWGALRILYVKKLHVMGVPLGKSKFYPYKIYRPFYGSHNFPKLSLGVLYIGANMVATVWPWSCAWPEMPCKGIYEPLEEIVHWERWMKKRGFAHCSAKCQLDLLTKHSVLFLAGKMHISCENVEAADSLCSPQPSSEWSNPLCQHSKPHNTQHTPDDFPIVHVFT